MTVYVKALLGAPAALALVLAAGPAAAHDPEAAQTARTPATPGIVKMTTAAAMIIVKDPDTGELRAPTAEEAAALIATPRFARFATLSAPAPRAYVTSSGARGLTLGESTLGSALARRNADGSLTEACVVGSASDAATLSAQAKKELPNE